MLLLKQEYANLQVSEPQIREGMKRVQPQTEDDLFPCTCHRKKVTRTELTTSVRIKTNIDPNMDLFL